MLVPRILTSIPSVQGACAEREERDARISSEDAGARVGTQTLFLQPKLELRGGFWSGEKGG